MKILRIVSSGFEEGGVENGIVLMQPVLEKMGHEVRTIASDRRMDLPRFDSYTFKSIKTSGFSKYIYNAFNPHSFFLLKKVLKEYRPDIVQLHTMGQVSPSVLFALKHTPTVLTIHGPEAFTKGLLLWYLPTTDFKDHSHDAKQLTFAGSMRLFYHRFISGTLYRMGMKHVDVTIVFSRYMQRLMQKEHIITRYVPNGTVLLEQRPITNTKTISFVGRLEKFKGVDYLLRALPAIVKKFPEVHLVIAGDGSYRTELEALARELNIMDNVSFRGHLSKEKIREMYRDATLLIMPSIWPEAFGKVGIEAMSVGRPVIAADVGGISDWLIDGEVGYLVPPKDPAAITEKVITLFSDEALLKTMSEKARRQSEKFSIESHTEKILEVYNEVIKKYKTS
ncbi:MAG TPA: glycosyltransferase family 4 protein [Candidatus Paceibacterota bacterium]|nr:glycosyltransferase family 4 protein [Candidatus Paceibacterota bacterium]